MNTRKISLALLACLLLAPGAYAADAVVSWTNPTTNSDGSAIPATGAGSLTGTRVEYGSCSGTAFGTSAGSVTVPAPATTVTIPGFVPGSTHCFRAFARNTYGNESLASNVAVKTFPTPTPNPPVLSSTITVAYELNYSGSDVKLGRVVGNIALGTPCLEQEVQTSRGIYNAVERKYVTLTREPKSNMLVTKCEIG